MLILSENRPTRTGRSRRAERSQHIYSARETFPVSEETVQQPASYPGFTPNEPEEQVWSGYTPNEERESPAQEWAGYTPNEEPDYAAFYSREGADADEAVEPAFAPPPKMDQYHWEEENWADEEPEPAYALNNVYQTRKASWVDDDVRDDAIAQSELGYQVQEEHEPPKKKKHTLRNLLIIVLILALLGGGAWLFRDALSNMLGVSVFAPEPTEEPFVAFVTPEPIKAYSEAPRAALADHARTAISRLSGNVQMDTYLVSDSHIITRNQRSNGTYDFYLFTAEGRLLCYFEGLDAQDMIPLEDGGFYVSQEPYLISSTGSALIRTRDLEKQLNEDLILHPLSNGWAIVKSAEDGSANYINLSGQTISTLWFSRTFPFTGSHTLAYVDTGAAEGSDSRYLLYVLDQEGSMSRWLATDDMTDVVAAACSMAYMNNGALYRLPDTSAPLLTTPEIHMYLDCAAMVVRDPASGKYGLFVNGEQHYDFVYDSITPVESDICWAEKTLSGAGGSITLHAVSGMAYPLPLSHSFVLQKEGASEYVALSTLSCCPIRLDLEF